MDYLTVKETAELKCCSVQILQKHIKDGKIFAEKQPHPQNKQLCYMIPVSALPEELQIKYYKQKRTETGVLPEKIESSNVVATPLQQRCKSAEKTFQEFSEAERETIRFWSNLLNQWQAERSERKDKTEFDKLFVAHQKYVNPEIEISVAILYRKYSFYKNECYSGLIDKRGGWNRGKMQA